MKKNLSDYFVALSVIACSVVLVGALVFALSGWKKDKTVLTYDIDFADMTGIRLHSQVRYAGAPAGAVSGIRLLTAEERASAPAERKHNAVRVTVALGETVPPIPADTRVTLSSDTLLSEKFVAFSAGSADAPKLPPGGLLQGAGATSLDAIIEKIGPLVESLNPLLRTAEETLKGFEPLMKKTGSAVDTLKTGLDDALPRISKLADALKVTAESADGALKRIDKLITEVEGPIKKDLEVLKDALTQLETTMASADKLLINTDKNLDARLDDLGDVLVNLKVATAYMKTTFKTLGEKPSRLIWGSKTTELPSEQEILRGAKPAPVKPRATPRR